MGFARLGDASEERVVLGRSRLGREEDVGVEIWGRRRPFTDVSRGEAMVDILLLNSSEGIEVADIMCCLVV